MKDKINEVGNTLRKKKKYIFWPNFLFIYFISFFLIFREEFQPPIWKNTEKTKTVPLKLTFLFVFYWFSP